MNSSTPDIRKLTPLLLLLFVGSGCAALIYEIVWFQLLRLTIGASAISIGITLASFMGGMCLGSYFFHRWIADRHHPLAVYGFLELGIAVFGLLNPLLIPAIGKLYFDITGYGYVDIVLRGLISAMFLVPPTILMGATLPAIARWMERSRRGVADLGLFYGSNIAGAVLGTGLAGFVLLRLFDIYVASAVALLINLLAGGLAIWLAKRHSYNPVVATADGKLPEATGSVVFWVIAFSGFTALGAQVIWTRLLSLYFGGTVYTFTIILSVFLVGLGIGSVVGARLGKALTSPLLAFAFTQLLLLPAVLWSSFAVNEVIHNIFLFGLTPENNFVTESNWLPKTLNDSLSAAIGILPATLLWGASFPLALALVAGTEKDPGRFTGQVYAANTLGAVAGALLFSALLIPFLGTRSAQQIVILSAAIGVALLLPQLAARRSANGRATSIIMVAAGLAAITLATALLMPRDNQNLLAYGRSKYFWDKYEYPVIREGINSTIAVSRLYQEGAKGHQFHVSGKVVASSLPADMRIQRQLGHLPALLHEKPRSVLIIGFGAGVTAGAFTLYRDVERIVIVEIEPSVPVISGEYFKRENYAVATDPRTEIIIDDGRHFLATTEETFDIITTDPIHPWVKGAASLYTREFYDLVKQRLNPGGLITQWVPFYESDEQAVKSQIATFFEAFPGGSIWNSQDNLEGYDVTLLGHQEPIILSNNKVFEKVVANKGVAESLGEVFLYQPLDLFRLYSGRHKDVESWLSDAQLNLDRNLRLEYLAGAALDMQIASDIYANMITDIEYPEDFFQLTEPENSYLRNYYRQIGLRLRSR
jgi:spermidine synthase